MAAGYLPAPGTEHGPCKAGCEHRDCAATRKMAESTCHFCDRSIGYEMGFYDDRTDEQRRALVSDAGFVHAGCLEVWYEQQRAAGIEV